MKTPLNKLDVRYIFMDLHWYRLHNSTNISNIKYCIRHLIGPQACEIALPNQTVEVLL